jgi:PAS domain S-box-containing protein
MNIEALQNKIKKSESETSRLKNVERKLSDCEQKLKALMAGPDCITITRLKDGKIIEANDHFFKTTGHNRDEVIGRTAKEINGWAKPDDRQLFIRILDEKEEVSNFETSFCHKDGSIVPYSMSARLIELNGEKCVISITRDITDRKKAEEDLQRSQSFLYNIINAFDDPVFVKDEDHRWVILNDKSCQLAGRSREELIGKTDYDFVPKEEADVFWQKDQLVFDTGKTNINEEKITLHGKTHTISTQKTLFIDSESGKKYIVGAIRDITEQKQAEEALRESEAKFRSLFDLSPQAIALSEIDSGRLVDVNDNFCRLTGYTKSDILQKRTTDIFYSKAKRKKFLNELKRSGEIRGLAMDFKIKSGEIANTLMFSKIIQILGQSLILTIFFDITEKKRLESKLHQIQRLEAIGTLAGGIAHDFNNILFPIIGYAELMMEEVQEESFIHHASSEILAAARRAQELAQQILTFSRESVPELKPIKIQPIIQEALKFIRSTIPSTIEIRQEIRESCPLLIANQVQIHQLIMNLVTNASHAMEDHGGVLEVSLEEVDLGPANRDDPEFPHGNHLCLTVSDTGTGMTEAVRERIFEPYFTTKEKGKGTGLGLSVVHGIVKSLGGDIGVSTKPGKGSTFTVYLPAINTIGKRPKNSAAKPVPGGTEQILLVDDEEPIVRMEEEMLKRLGYRLVPRTSSIEALEAFRAQPDKFDLVITDMTMPNMTGARLAKEILKIRSDIPIILCTGYSEKIPKEKLSAISYVMKPVSMSQIARTIREALDKGLAGAKRKKHV